ncbi:MAG TPA: universal stress protein, partial [Sphingobacterium sp.]|nr:universal stress protein [Sphingobacterium sp.]
KYGFWSSLTHRSKTRMMASGLDVPLLTISI